MTVVSFGYESLELFRSRFRLRVEDSIGNTFVNLFGILLRESAPRNLNSSKLLRINIGS